MDAGWAEEIPPSSNLSASRQNAGATRAASKARKHNNRTWESNVEGQFPNSNGIALVYSNEGPVTAAVCHVSNPGHKKEYRSNVKKKIAAAGKQPGEVRGAATPEIQDVCVSRQILKTLRASPALFPRTGILDGGPGGKPTRKWHRMVGAPNPTKMPWRAVSPALSRKPCKREEHRDPPVYKWAGTRDRDSGPDLRYINGGPLGEILLSGGGVPVSGNSGECCWMQSSRAGGRIPTSTAGIRCTTPNPETRQAYSPMVRPIPASGYGTQRCNGHRRSNETNPVVQ